MKVPAASGYLTVLPDREPFNPCRALRRKTGVPRPPVDSDIQVGIPDQLKNNTWMLNSTRVVPDLSEVSARRGTSSNYHVVVPGPAKVREASAHHGSNDMHPAIPDPVTINHSGRGGGSKRAVIYEKVQVGRHPIKKKPASDSKRKDKPESNSLKYGTAAAIGAAALVAGAHFAGYNPLGALGLTAEDQTRSSRSPVRTGLALAGVAAAGLGARELYKRFKKPVGQESKAATESERDESESTLRVTDPTESEPKKDGNTFQAKTVLAGLAILLLVVSLFFFMRKETPLSPDEDLNAAEQNV